MRLIATVDARGEIERSFRAMLARGRSLPSAFDAIKRAARIDQADHARNRTGPAGSWAPRAASTITKARAGRRRLPRPLGKLLSQVTYTSSAHGMRAVSRVGWSGVHQEGGTVGRGAKIPARPFLWISDALLTKATAIIERALLAAFGGT